MRNWTDLVLKNLNQTTDEYLHLLSEDLVGLHICLFAKKNVRRNILNLASSKVKLGFSGNMGNKGSTCLRFTYEDTSFCFANCHLESGHSLDLIKTRAQQASDVFNQAFIRDRGT